MLYFLYNRYSINKVSIIVIIQKTAKLNQKLYLAGPLLDPMQITKKAIVVVLYCYQFVLPEKYITLLKESGKRKKME